MTLSTSPLLVTLTLISGVSTPGHVIYHGAQREAESRQLAERFEGTVAFLPVGLGSGTLIAPRWILTAGHVGRGLSPFSPRVRVGGEDYAVRQVIAHPRSKSDGLRPAAVDLALVELETPVEGVRPVPLYAGSDEAGRPVFVVGYGDFGPAGEPFKRADGVRRAVTNTVDEARDGRLFIDFDAPSEADALEGVGLPGDSGGPLYLETAKGVTLAGVSSGSMGRPGQIGVVDVYVRVSEFVQWIKDTRERAATEPPRRVETQPLDEGFPDGARGDLAAYFFEVFNLGEEGGLRGFAEDLRSAAALRRSPHGAFVERMLSLAEQHGKLTPLRLAPVGPERWIVLVGAEKGGSYSVILRFRLEESELRLDDVGLRGEP